MGENKFQTRLTPTVLISQAHIIPQNVGTSLFSLKM